MSEQSLQVSTDNVYLEDDIVWSDDPNKAYFASVIERNVLNRMATGKHGDDSLVGNSTKEEIMEAQARGDLESRWLQMNDEINAKGNIDEASTDEFPPIYETTLFDVISTATKSLPEEQANPERPVLPTSEVIHQSTEPQPPEFIFCQKSGQAGYKPPPGVIDPKYIRARQRRRRRIRLLFLLFVFALAGALAAVFLKIGKNGRESNSSASALTSNYTPSPAPQNSSQALTKKPLVTTSTPTFSPSSNESTATPSTMAPSVQGGPSPSPAGNESNSPANRRSSIPTQFSSTAVPTPKLKIGKETQTPTLQPSSQPISLPSGPTKRPSKPSRRPTPDPTTWLPSFNPSSATASPITTQPTTQTAQPTVEVTTGTLAPSTPPSPSPTPQPKTTQPTVLSTSPPTSGSTTPLIEQAKAYVLQFSPDSASALSDTSTPQYQAMEWLSSDPFFLQGSNPKSIYRWALATLYFSTSGSQWIHSNNWVSSEDECSWFTRATAGQNCNGDGFLSELILNRNKLQGLIPPELSLFSDIMVRVNLGNNTLGGSLPSKLGGLKSLVSLELSGNQLVGDLPTELGDMTSLTELELNDNQFSGTLPAQLGNLVSLESFGVFGNQLQGTIPTTFGQLGSLQILDVNDNRITGLMPTELGALASLVHLTAIYNNMTGTVPDVVCNLNLQQLEVDCTTMTCSCCTNCVSTTTVTTEGGITTWHHEWTYFS